MRQINSFLLAAAIVCLFGCLTAASSSATILTDGSGKQLPAGTLIKAESETMQFFHWPFWPDTVCEKSTLEAKITNAGGVESTVVALVLGLTFSGCSGGENCSVVALKGGELTFHTEKLAANGNGTVTSSGLELTNQCTWAHCVWKTSNINIGVITGGTPGRLDVNAKYARSSGALCSETQIWTGIYKFTSPTSLVVD
jgi:hypothetical protein